MSIENLTIGEVGELISALRNGGQSPSQNIYTDYIGKYVIVRSRNEGVNAGYVVAIDATGVVLSDSRRLWRHRPAKGLWYEGVANHGLSSDGYSRLSDPLKENKVIVENYSITICTPRN